MTAAKGSSQGIGLLQSYESDNSESGEEAAVEAIGEQPSTSAQPAPSTPLAPPKPALHHAKLAVDSAPVIADDDQRMRADPRNQIFIDAQSKQLQHNPKLALIVKECQSTDAEIPWAKEDTAKNMLTGYVESAGLSDYHFDSQRLSYMSYGLKQREDVSTEVPTCKRARLRNADAGDLEGFTGPWAKYTDERGVSVPSDEDKKYLEEYLAKMKGRKAKTVEEAPVEDKSILHLKEPVDYQGRPWTYVPADVGVNLRPDSLPDKCFMPKRKIFTFQGHTKAVNTIKWFPKSAHLLLSCGMDCKIKIWEVYKERRCCRTYLGHKQGVRDVNFNNSGSQFLSASYDRFIKLWDTESGKVIQTFANRRVAYCVKFHPDDNKQHLFVCGCADKKVLCWDTRANQIVQEYDRHLGAVNTITFIDQNRRFVTTSDDKTIRVWEWDIPVDFKYVADPSMHSMPAVATSMNGKWLAAQSMDNKVVMFNIQNRMRMMRKKTFKGHMVAGYACGLDFSPDVGYLISGDADGRLFVWDFKTHQLATKIKAHDSVCIDVLWHPHETSKVATCGWDNMINLFD